VKRSSILPCYWPPLPIIGPLCFTTFDGIYRCWDVVANPNVRSCSPSAIFTRCLTPVCSPSAARSVSRMGGFPKIFSDGQLGLNLHEGGEPLHLVLRSLNSFFDSKHSSSFCHFAWRVCAVSRSCDTVRFIFLSPTDAFWSIFSAVRSLHLLFHLVAATCPDPCLCL
jgi:hypothetical protein